ncbi:SEFIR domain-containing protein [Amycolatopsis sp. cmx-8-4]|uniref:SEFIR domain-containing protein n=1 Tax=Amycolatopsis sp. cmx-8-4 TaxID=2790947 RepID=UPI003979A007
MADEGPENRSRRHISDNSENRSPRVFISYAHDNAVHNEAVRILWHLLRNNGIDAELDLHAAQQRQDWAAWHQQQIQEADFTLIIASPEYKSQSEGNTEPTQGRSVHWESLLIREEMYRDRQSALKKFLPVILPDHSVDDLPAWLNPGTATSYTVNILSTEGITALLRIMTRQQEEQEVNLGANPLFQRSAHIVADEFREGVSQTPASSTNDSRLIAPLSGLFLHFFDPHFLQEVSAGRNMEQVGNEARRATQLAVLAAQTVYLPAASYLESDLCAQIINRYRPLFEFGQVILVGSEANLVDFATLKMLQYEEGGQRYFRYRAALDHQDETPPFRTRQRSATTDIRTAWWHGLSNLGRFTEGITHSHVPDLEIRWAEVPATLAGRAFTPEYAVHALFATSDISGVQEIIARRAGSYINQHYTNSYVTELKVGVVKDLSYLHSPHVPSAGVDLPFNATIRALTELGVADELLTASPIELVNLRADTSISRALVKALQKTP